MTDWTEKYRPETLDDVIGNPAAVNTMRSWAKSWNSGIPDLRAMVLIGTPGLGKTSSALALAREMGWDTVEMNASDQRTGPEIERIAILGSKFNTFGSDGSFMSSSSGGHKLIILDEADSLSGTKDRGALPVINRLIKETRQPVILIVNDFQALVRKSSVIKTSTLQVTFKRPVKSTVSKALYRIAESEGVEVEAEAMEMIAANADGDMRAAVRNLQSLALGQDTVTAEMASELSKRDDRSDMYELMSAIFRGHEPSKARTLAIKLDSEPGDIMIWVDENLPYEFRNKGDLMRGYEKISKADIFLSRVRRRQYYRFMAYASDLMTMGVASSRMSEEYSRDRLHFPSYLMKMSRSKAVRATRASVVYKIAVNLHTSTKRVELDVLQPFKTIAQNDETIRQALVQEFGFDEEEMGFILDEKKDSKEMKALFKSVNEALEERRLQSQRSTPSDAGDPDPVVKAPEPEQKQEEPVAVAEPKKTFVQRSLFDFRGSHGREIP
ncbi:MAG: replication factor C large subunit [Candidatus Methanomethylophilaceae archaeon]|nr:replication factor C large subunit [Candidatus Methanomethylophilaceae archaeon]